MSSLKDIDLNRLKRDYSKYPLQTNEFLSKGELVYLYIELNLRQSDLWKFLGVGDCKFRKMLKMFEIVKPKNLHNALIDESNLLRYGSKRPMGNPEFASKIWQVKKERYGEHLEKVVEKTKKNNLLKYGVEFTNSLEEKKKRIRETNLKKYGYPCSFQAESVKKKIRKTCLERYGVENIFSLPGFFAKYDCNRAISKPELRCFEFLKGKFKEVYSQYFDEERYPFHCDIYIKDLDLFIECQFGPHHQFCKFDPKNQLHLLRKCRLLTNKSDRVKSWVKFWTEIDPLKRKIASDNHLNFLEFFKEKDLYENFS